MTEREAVRLFKRDCFDERSWERICKRYKGKNCDTLVKFIIETYGVKNKKAVEDELHAEFLAIV